MNFDRAVFTKVRNIRIFKRNVDECNFCCRYNINPSDRTRFNHPNSPSPSRPSRRDLGYMLLELADFNFQRFRAKFRTNVTILGQGRVTGTRL